MNSVRRSPIRMPGRFLLPMLAILLIGTGSFLSLSLISNQKLQYALFQRDLLALVARWGGLVRTTALLSVSGYSAPIAYKDGQSQMAEVRQQVAQMEQTLKQAGSTKTSKAICRCCFKASAGA